MNKISLQILIVEKTEEDFLLTKKLIGEIKIIDFEAHYATNYQAAKKTLAEKKFDACLVNYDPSEHGALEFLTDAADFHVPVILLIGQNEDSIETEFINAVAADYLFKKELNAGLLERSIRYAVETRRAEDILESTVKRERTMFESSVNLICTIDREGNFVSVNPAYLKVLGYHPEELIGRCFIDYIAPEDVERSNEAAAIVMAGGEVTEFENCCPHKDGTPVHLVWTSYWSESDQLMFATAHDITVRKQMEKNLRDSEFRYRQLFESNPHPILIYDMETLDILAVNEKIIQHYGYSREEFQKMKIKELRPPEEYPIFEQYIAQSGSNTERFYSARHRKKDGTLINVEIAAHTISFAGKRAGLVLITDVTEKNNAQAAIRESEGKYRNILETIEDGYFETSLSGKLTFFNDALCDLLGYSREELIGVDYRKYMDAENAEKLHEFFADFYNTNQSKQLLRWEVIRKNGQRKIHESSISLIKNEDGKSIGFRGLVRDITDRIQSEKDLDESQQLLRLMIDTLPQAIWWKDREGIYKGANRYIAGVAGFESPEQMLGLNDYDMPWTKEEADLYREVDRRVMKTGIAELDMTETQLQSDGRTAVVTTNKVPLRDWNGEIVGVLGTFSDITEQKRSDAAMRENEYKLRTLLESMREGILQVDSRDRVVYINDCFCEMVDYSSEELMNSKWTRLVFDEEGRDLVKQVKERRKNGISDSYELCLKKKSGERLWVMVGGAPIINAEGIITGSMGVFTDITTRKRAEEQLLHDAFHDGLTGLANRTLFNDHLQRTIERAKRYPKEIFAVLFLDFDRFKVVNDSLGHAEGDNLLKQIARRLESCLRKGDLVARLGGDEFTILVNKIKHPAVALRVAERVQESMQLPFDIGGGEIYTSVSIGIALSTSEQSTAEEMVRDADIAMYRAKAKGKAQHQVFDRTMHEQASKQLRLETEIRQALERKEFILNYQPILKLDSEMLVGFEALVRWKHPERGIIPPFEFIPAAEENGLILPLGNWILHESCRQLQFWRETDPSASHLTMSVNLSSKQFLQPDLAEQVADALEKTGLNPRRLKLEITESHIMENNEMAAETMTNLRKMGIEFSLDDFGTGYSSLSYLHRLPVTYLKVDRSFVMRMIESEENSEIINTIIRLAQNLKMRVIAEGIETAEQLARLKILNCEFGQGYFFAKPLGAKEIESLMKKALK